MKLTSVFFEHLLLSVLSTSCKPGRQAWNPSASIINAPLKRCTSYLNQSSRLSYWVEEDVLFVVVHTHKEFSVGLDPLSLFQTWLGDLAMLMRRYSGLWHPVLVTLGHPPPLPPLLLLFSPLPWVRSSSQDRAAPPRDLSSLFLRILVNKNNLLSPHS